MRVYTHAVLYCVAVFVVALPTIRPVPELADDDDVPEIHANCCDWAMSRVHGGNFETPDLCPKMMVRLIKSSLSYMTQACLNDVLTCCTAKQGPKIFPSTVTILTDCMYYKSTEKNRAIVFPPQLVSCIFVFVQA